MPLPVSMLSKVHAGEERGKKNHFILSVALNSVCEPDGNEAYKTFSLCCDRRLPWSQSVSFFPSFFSFLFTPFLLLTRTIPPWLPATREQRSLIVL